MGDRGKCIRCGDVHLGMPMAYREGGADHVGHVCFVCEDTILHMVEAGVAGVRFLNAVEEVNR